MIAFHAGMGNVRGGCVLAYSRVASITHYLSNTESAAKQP